MSPSYLLALDAGTSGLRCLIFNPRGKLVSSQRQDYPCSCPAEAPPLAREFQAQELWQMTCRTIGLALTSAGIDAADIAGVSATSQREGSAFLDQAGCELYVGPNIDLRAVTVGLMLDNLSGPWIHGVTGHLPSLMFVPARLKWFEKNRPELFGRISLVLSLSGWLLYRLCGVKALEPSEAVEIGLADVAKRQLSPELANRLKLPSGMFPPLLPAGRRLGTVTAEAAAATGLEEGTPVVQGGPDAQCALLALGVLETGQVGVASGWSAPVQMVTDRPIFDVQRRIWSGCHVLADRWVLESNSGESGRALEWLRENVFAAASYAEIEREALGVPAGSEGVVAYLGPEAMDMGNLGLRWGGFFLPLPFSASAVARPQLARAAMENIAFAIKLNLLQLESVSGLAPVDFKLGGGLAGSACLRQILPSLLNREVGFARVSETSGLGAAILAAAGCGMYPLEEARLRMQTPFQSVQPDSLLCCEYQEHFQRWQKAGRWFKGMGEELN
jgi:sugar (pentulose or hexulose) kinase